MLEGHEKCVICMIVEAHNLASSPHEVVKVVTQANLVEMIKGFTRDIGWFHSSPPMILTDSQSEIADLVRDPSFRSMRVAYTSGRHKQDIYEGLRDQMRCFDEANIYPIVRRPDYVESPVERLESQNTKDKKPPSHLLSSLVKRFRVKEGYEKPDSEKSWGPMFVNPNSSSDCARDES